MSTYSRAHRRAPAWTPSAQQRDFANVARFMRAHGIATVDELRRRSLDSDWFWDAVVRDVGIPFDVGYGRVRDDSAGKEWTTWFVGGQLNAATACVDRWSIESPGRIALRWMGEDGTARSLTYGELSDLTGRFAGALQALGAGHGDVVGLYLPMIPEAAISLFGCAKAGAIALPIFSGFGADAVATRLADSGASLLITADGFLRRGKPVDMRTVAERAAQSVRMVRRTIVVPRLGGTTALRPGHDLAWDDFLGLGERRSADMVNSEHPMLLMYTSGTTGRPKGAVLVHGGTLATMARDAVYHFDLQQSDTLCWITDMGWIMGPWQIIAAGVTGACVVMLEGLATHPSPARLWKLIDSLGISVLGVGPSLIRAIASSDSGEVEDHNFGSLRVLGATGEPWNADAWMWLFEKIGHQQRPIINISGGTEVGGGLLAPLPIESQVPCTLGGPCLGMDVDVVDPVGDSLPPGQIGELVCRNSWPGMTRGIWRDPERYLDTYWRRLPGVWVQGDLASRDESGYWFLHGRSDDTLNIAGKRLGPPEVESILNEHPAVAESAAVAVPHAVKGEAIWCFVLLRDDNDPVGELSQTLQRQVADRLGNAFRPDRIVFVNELPRTRSAKIVRRAIRAAVLGLDPGDISGLEDPSVLDSIRDAVALRVS